MHTPAERERTRQREKVIWSRDRGQLARVLKGSGRECVKVKHNSPNPFLQEWTDEGTEKREKWNGGGRVTLEQEN